MHSKQGQCSYRWRKHELKQFNFFKKGRKEVLPLNVGGTGVVHMFHHTQGKN